MEDIISITITGEGLSLTKKTNLQKAGQIISFLGIGQNTQGIPNQSHSPSFAVASSPIQPKEVIVTSGAKTYPQKIAALAVYLKNQVGQNSFTPQELKLIFKKMGDEPKNFTRDLKIAVELGYVTCIDPTTESYELTDKGIEVVKGVFSQKTTKKSMSSKRMPISNGIRDEIKGMEVVGTCQNLPEYHDLLTKADKILWLLAYSDQKGVNSLTPTEVDHMSGVLRDRVESKGFTALNARNIKNSFVSKTISGFQIQKKGFDYLQSKVTGK